MNSLLALCLLATAPDLPNGEQFARIMADALGSIRDQAFVYEGQEQYIGPEAAIRVDPLHPTSPKGLGKTFLGSFAARSDGAILVDQYHRSFEEPGVLYHATYAILGDRTETRGESSEGRQAVSRVIPNAAPASLLRTGSPMRLVYTWYFQDVKHLPLLDYQCHGFEKVANRNCLHVSVNAVTGVPASRAGRSHYWIDLERGGHPIRVEHRLGDQLGSRVTIELRQVEDAKGQRLWFPVKCRMDAHNFNGVYAREPFFQETLRVIPESIRINQGLDDTVFDVKSRGVAESPKLREIREEFLRLLPLP